MRNDFTFLNAQNSHRNIKEAQFQMSIKPGSWMLFRREEETQRHNLIPMAIDEVGFKRPKFVILPSKPLSKDDVFSSIHSMDPIKGRLSPSGLGRGLMKD
ncbi:uncharacterized protein LOC136034025 isoform X2 [Artemia franciscana]|uniref:uncharacterized protein LOC136034025 isoform X2 n=1 Tax=Artemia franciscana TaxID=6661 RepID=UPI0032DB31C6